MTPAGKQFGLNSVEYSVKHYGLVQVTRLTDKLSRVKTSRVQMTQDGLHAHPTSQLLNSCPMCGLVLSMSPG